MSERLPGPSSPRQGWQHALQLRRLVFAVWIASWMAVAPALVLLRRIVASALSSLPAGPGEVPDTSCCHEKRGTTFHGPIRPGYSRRPARRLHR